MAFMWFCSTILQKWSCIETVFTSCTSSEKAPTAIGLSNSWADITLSKTILLTWRRRWSWFNTSKATSTERSSSLLREQLNPRKIMQKCSSKSGNELKRQFFSGFRTKLYKWSSRIHLNWYSAQALVVSYLWLAEERYDRHLSTKIWRAQILVCLRDWTTPKKYLSIWFTLNESQV